MAAGFKERVGDEGLSENERARGELAERLARLVWPRLPDESRSRFSERARRHLGGQHNPARITRRPVELALRRRDLRLTIEDAAAGDADARAKLYERFADRIGAQLRRGVFADEAEDLVHVTFERAWEALARGDYDYGRPFSPWLSAIARNAWIDHLRAHRHFDFTDPDVLGRVAEARGVNLVTEPAVEKALGWMSNHRLAQALRLLSPTQRDVLTLSFLGDFSNAEVAKIVGSSSASVAALKSQALARLRARPDFAK